MMRFDLVRDNDETGVSGEGRIATGVVFEDGSCAMRWLTRVRSTAVYECLADLFYIHGHGGKTRVVPEAGFVACNRTQAGHEVAWAHEVDGAWCVDVVSYHRNGRAEFKRLSTASDEAGAWNHAALFIIHAVMECGGEHYMSHKIHTVIA